MNKPTPQLIAAEIDSLARLLVTSGLADETLGTSIRSRAGETLAEPSEPVGREVMRLESYEALYRRQSQQGAYQVRLLDGALLQLSYAFVGRNISRHRLAYLPSPSLLPFESEPDLYLGEVPFLDVVGRQIMVVPLRFDFDNRPEADATANHPASHLTLGQYANGRIPVSGPVLPWMFVSFVVGHFYRHGPAWTNPISPGRMRSFADRIDRDDLASTHIRLAK